MPKQQAENPFEELFDSYESEEGGDEDEDQAEGTEKTDRKNKRTNRSRGAQPTADAGGFEGAEDEGSDPTDTDPDGRENDEVLGESGDDDGTEEEIEIPYSEEDPESEEI